MVSVGFSVGGNIVGAQFMGIFDLGEEVSSIQSSPDTGITLASEAIEEEIRLELGEIMKRGSNEKKLKVKEI